jgi:arsenite-transporting ATPase
MDTAPTGHTLLLLDATGSYSRDMLRHLADGQTSTTPLQRLQDPEMTKVIIVTLPELTPVLEAGLLEQDLQRAKIPVWAWVVNQSLAATEQSSPLLRYRAAAELPHIDQVVGRSPRMALVAAMIEEPTSQDTLHTLGTSSATGHKGQ